MRRAISVFSITLICMQMAGPIGASATPEPSPLTAAAVDVELETVWIDMVDASIQEIEFDRSEFVYVRTNKDIRVYRLPSWRHIRTIDLDDYINEIVIVDEGATIIAGRGSEIVELDSQTGETLATYELGPPYGHWGVWALVTDGTHVLAATLAGLYLADRESGEVTTVAPGVEAGSVTELVLDSDRHFAYIHQNEPGYPKKLDWTDPTIPVVASYDGEFAFTNITPDLMRISPTARRSTVSAARSSTRRR